MKHLHEKNEQYATPDREILDSFPNPGVIQVTLTQGEFTSLCPLTGQPDYAEIEIKYGPKELCIESKSLKLYLSAYRNFGGFAETIAKMICEDLYEVLKPKYIQVNGRFVSRGGISIDAFVTRSE